MTIIQGGAWVELDRAKDAGRTVSDQVGAYGKSKPGGVVRLRVSGRTEGGRSQGEADWSTGRGGVMGTEAGLGRAGVLKQTGRFTQFSPGDEEGLKGTRGGTAEELTVRREGGGEGSQEIQGWTEPVGTLDVQGWTESAGIQEIQIWAEPTGRQAVQGWAELAGIGKNRGFMSTNSFNNPKNVPATIANTSTTGGCGRVFPPSPLNSNNAPLAAHDVAGSRTWSDTPCGSGSEVLTPSALSSGSGLVSRSSLKSTVRSGLVYLHRASR